MGSILQESLPGQTELLPGIGVHSIEFHNGRGYYYFTGTKEHSLPLDKRTFKCAKEQCNVTARMESGLGSLIDNESHCHDADLSYRDKCVLLQVIRERFLQETVPPSVVLKQVLDSVLENTSNEKDNSSEHHDFTAVSEKNVQYQIQMKEEPPEDVAHTPDVSDEDVSVEVVLKEEPTEDVVEVDSDDSDPLVETLRDVLSRPTQKRKISNRKPQNKKRRKTVKESVFESPSPEESLSETAESLRNMLGERNLSLLYPTDAIEEWKKQVTCTLTYLKRKLDDMFDILSSFAQRGATNSDDIADEEYLNSSLVPDKPLTTKKQLDELEKTLQIRPNYDQMVKKLSQFGGNSTKEVTRRLLRIIFSDDLAQIYSLKGFKGKLVFSNLSIKNAIFDAVQRNPPTANASVADIENVVKDWLRQAKFRAIAKKSKKYLEVAAQVTNLVAVEDSSQGPT